MVEENVYEAFRPKNIDKTRNYLIEEINQSELMSKKHKKICATLNCLEHFFYFSFYSYRICFHFCFCLFDWYSYRNYEFCNWIKNLCNNCRN